MEVRMKSTERVFPNGFDAPPKFARAGKTYTFPDAVAQALIDAGQAESTAPAPEPEPVKPGPSARKVAAPAEIKVDVT